MADILWVGPQPWVAPNTWGNTSEDPPFSEELLIQRRLTREFILRVPSTIVLTPRTQERTSSGGYVWVEGTPRGSQVMTLIETSGISGQPMPEFTSDGVERKVVFELLGEYGAGMEVGDVFTHQGADFEVVGIFYGNGYERRGMVAARG